MKRFKEGDKVRAVKQVLDVPEDTEGVVFEVYTFGYDYGVNFPGKNAPVAMNDDELELVAQTIEVGDKVRATSEFTVDYVFASGVLAGTDGVYRDPRVYTFEVIEKALKITFTVGQVLTTEDELKALPEGAKVSRFFRDGSGLVYRKSVGAFLPEDYEYTSRTADEMFGYHTPPTITVVWLP